jgi:hypothetical protein
MNWLKSFLNGFTMPLESHPESGGARENAGLGNFTPHAQQVLALARREAARLNHQFVGTEHLLLGIVSLGEGVAVQVLRRLGLSLDAVRAEVEKHVGKGPDGEKVSTIPYTPRVKKVLAIAAKRAKALDHTYVGTEHILLGLLDESEGVAARVLSQFHVEPERTQMEILKELNPNAGPYCDPEWTEIAKSPPTARATRFSNEPLDTSKRYDIYCHEQDRQVVYRNALLKGVKTLFKTRDTDALSEFMELEQSDGQIVLVPRHSMVKLCAPGTTPSTEVANDPR